MSAKFPRGGGGSNRPSGQQPINNFMLDKCTRSLEKTKYIPFFRLQSASPNALIFFYFVGA